MREKIIKVQEILQKEGIDGWLLYHFPDINPLARQFMEIAPERHLTRRLFYWIPMEGQPIKISSIIESSVADHLPGKLQSYFSWEELHKHLKELLRGKQTIAMEYSPNAGIPYLSEVDGGTIDLIRGFGANIVSSANLLLPFTSHMSSLMLKTHRKAATVVENTAKLAWATIYESITKEKRITDFEVQQMMVAEFRSSKCTFDGMPMCAVNEDSASPHYSPSKSSERTIQKGDFVLIDLFCKTEEKNSIYADITQVAVVDKKPTEKQQKIFSLVRQAQSKATELIRKRFEEKKSIFGYEVDLEGRNFLREQKMDAYFTHRIGHNLYTSCHGPGTHMDSVETFDDRPLLPSTCFTIEPGLYIPGEFGVRLEYDLYIHENGSVEITTPIQEKIFSLLSEKG